jgi:hypothetical protein
MNLEERFEALDKLVRRLEDSLVVEAAMASRYRDRHDEWLRDHQRWLENQQRAMEAHNRAMKRHDRAMAELDKKLDRIADMPGFRGGNGGG